MINKEEAKNLRTYFLFTYLIFWALLAVTGYIISLDAPMVIQNIMQNVCAWTPTFVILIMFRKLYPGLKIKEYLRLHFTKKISPLNFLMSFLLQAGILVLVVLSFFLLNNKPLNSMTFIGVANIIPAFIMALTSGALGEELGWRGYALNIFQKKYTPLIAAIIVGVIWGLWHLPLMLLSGFSGLELIYYMLAFMLSIVSLSVIITFFYNKSKNILIAMWLHFWFNFLLKLVVIDILPLQIYLSVAYLIAAIIIVMIKRRDMMVKEVQTN